MSENQKLSKIPWPPKDSDEWLARSIIENILNFSLNKHIHKLDEQGCLKYRKHFKNWGWEEGSPKEALQLKFDLMDEVIETFQPQIVEQIRSHANKS